MQLVVTVKLKARCLIAPSLNAHKAAAMNQTVSVFSNEALLISCGNGNYDSTTTAG
jgi:hypothetical protein